MTRKKPVVRGETPDISALQKWVASGPLYAWREVHRVTRPQCAAIFGVGSTTIWQWEHGAAQPTKEHMAELIRVLGPETIERWLRWLNGKPRVV